MPIETVEEKIAMKDLERKPFSSEAMRVRCPHCRKLYMVQFTDVQEAKPRFECVQCHSRFWLSMPDTDFTNEVIGIPVQVKDTPKPKPGGEIKPCPKCFKPVQTRLTECPHCGVVMDKVRELSFTEGTFGRSTVLAAAWQRVLTSYDDPEAHDAFIRLAQREGNLLFAGTQYSQIQKLMASDEITRKRIGEVQAMAAVSVPDVDRSPRRRQYARIWQVPLAAATMMILVGSMFPVFRNLVGAGAAILFIAIAIQIQARRKS